MAIFIWLTDDSYLNIDLKNMDKLCVFLGLNKSISSEYCQKLSNYSFNNSIQNRIQRETFSLPFSLWRRQQHLKELSITEHTKSLKGMTLCLSHSKKPCLQGRRVFWRQNQFISVSEMSVGGDTDQSSQFPCIFFTFMFITARYLF